MLAKVDAMNAMLLESPDQAAVLPHDLLARFDTNGPRYTSYPTADRFVDAFGPASYLRALRQRAAGATVGGRQPLSIYVHVPFCESVCYYCACNKVVTRHHDRAAPYLDALEREIDRHFEVFGGRERVSQLHFGGGTPTFLSDDELGRLIMALRTAFRIAPDAEISIEVDPRTVTPQRLAVLAQMGFNRISFGIQDFDPDVQRAVHRVQSFESVAALLEAARRLGLRSTNIDLIHGLPHQTPESFARTLAQVSALRPDRIALYAYAHLPQRFKAQRRIETGALPTGRQRVDMLDAAIRTFCAAGYDYIGMDHFALHADTLSVARRQGRLHRNFQGYSTQPDCDLIGLGVSAISRIGATYSQNAKTLDEYYGALANGQFPTVRGIALTRDDLLRRAVIMALMCQGRVVFESIESAYLVDFASCFEAEMAALAPLRALGLVEIDEQAIQVTPQGWFLVRAIAMAFDRHLQSDARRERFSRVI